MLLPRVLIKLYLLSERLISLSYDIVDINTYKEVMCLKQELYLKVLIILAVAILALDSVHGVIKSTCNIPSTGRLSYGKWPICSICVFPYDDYYSQSGTDSKLDELKTRLPEVNFIDIRTYWQPDLSNPDNMTYTGGGTGYLGTPLNSLEELEAMMSKVRSRGMDVILWACKVPGGPSPTPSNWTIWLQNYAKYAKGVAQWAQVHHIPIFVFGAEYQRFLDVSLLGSNYVEQWNNIISEIRSVYSGKVVYGVNWWYAPLHWNTIYNESLWMANLDYIQVDSYVSLGMNCYDGGSASEIAKWWNPTVKDLVGNWTDSRFGPHWNYTQMY